MQTGRQNRAVQLTLLTRSWSVLLMALGVGAVLGIGCECSLPGQSPAQPSAPGTLSPSFEVASVRPSPPGLEACFSMSPYGTDLFVARCIGLKTLIAFAYGTSDRDISGISESDASRLFDISARAEGNVLLNREQLQPLLRSLLRDRFHLAVEHGTRQVEGYVLRVAPGRPKLSPVPIPKGSEDVAYDGSIFTLPTGLQGRAITMKTLAGLLSIPLHAPVIDETGMNGNYNVSLRYASGVSDDSALPSVFTALREQIGLRVIRQHVTQSILMVKHVDREPTPD